MAPLGTQLFSFSCFCCFLWPSWGILGPSWDQLVAILGAFWDHIGAILCHIWTNVFFNFFVLFVFTSLTSLTAFSRALRTARSALNNIRHRASQARKGVSWGRSFLPSLVFSGSAPAVIGADPPHYPRLPAISRDGLQLLFFHTSFAHRF